MITPNSSALTKPLVKSIPEAAVASAKFVTGGGGGSGTGGAGALLLPPPLHAPSSIKNVMAKRELRTTMNFDWDNSDSFLLVLVVNELSTTQRN